ncbi:cell division protein FtsQ [Rubricella aquisinus]|uniref:Cell division protein FtsQ n=1 Tax=Rubricella aquisinus TaxID=2028108 RepID=A0A840X018_9RHOB|nr:cell division protein FtsQ/DivIB [Rubricella aquisinus]MBB5516064.1 cell division protein FtsQ [Rubricella aquisinus]
MQPVKPRRDPAPSRLAYRISRLWMRRGVRRAVTVWLPATVAVCAVAGVALYPSHRALIAQTYTELRQDVITHPRFMVDDVTVAGTAADVEALIREKIAPVLPASALTLDLAALRLRIEEVPAVRNAALSINETNTLTIDIQQRRPAAVWRHAGGLDLIDRHGVVLGPLDARAARPDLPLVIGQGAAPKVSEAQIILDAIRPILGDVRGIVRMGERRWDIVLAGNRRILLPESRPEQAALRLMALNRSTDLLQRDIALVDLRDEARAIVRLGPDAVPQMRRLRAMTQEEDA